MRHRISVVLLAAVVFAAVVGCAGAERAALDSRNPATITLWHYYSGENQQMLERSVTRFNQTIGIEKGIIVDAVSKGSVRELEAAVTDSAKGNINAADMPDIFSAYPDKVMEIDETGMLCDLNEYFTEAEKARYVDEFLASGIFSEERFLVVPIVKSTELLYVNKTAWDAYAAERQQTMDNLSTWEGVYAIARDYYQWSGGKALFGFDSVANYIVSGARQLGLDVIDGETAQANLNSAGLRRLFELYYCGYSLGYFDAVGKYRSDDIKSGDLIAYAGSSSGAIYFPTWIEQNNTQQPIDFTALPYPVFAGETSYAIQQGAGMCVAKSTPQEEEGAALFLKWFTEPQQNIEFSMTTGYLPVQKEAYLDDEFEITLDELNVGGKAQNNVAAVYEIALDQIRASNTYVTKPFTGSYRVRLILQSSLIAAAEEGRVYAEGLRALGLSETEIAGDLASERQYNIWIDMVTEQLDKHEIAYQR